MNLLWNRKNNKLLLHMHYSACIYATSHSPHSYVFWMICVLSLGKVVDEAQMGPLVPLVNFHPFSVVGKRQKRGYVKLPFLMKISRHEYLPLWLKITCYLLLIWWCPTSRSWHGPFVWKKSCKCFEKVFPYHLSLSCIALGGKYFRGILKRERDQRLSSINPNLNNKLYSVWGGHQYCPDIAP